jgi:hypothetical protein
VCVTSEKPSRTPLSRNSGRAQARLSFGERGEQAASDAAEDLRDSVEERIQERPYKAVLVCGGRRRDARRAASPKVGALGLSDWRRTRRDGDFRPARPRRRSGPRSSKMSASGWHRWSGRRASLLPPRWMAWQVTSTPDLGSLLVGSPGIVLVGIDLLVARGALTRNVLRKDAAGRDASWRRA